MVRQGPLRILYSRCTTGHVLKVEQGSSTLQVYLPRIKEEADDNDFYRSFGPYRALELFVLLTAGWCELHCVLFGTLNNHLPSQIDMKCLLKSCTVCLVLAESLHPATSSSLVSPPLMSKAASLGSNVAVMSTLVQAKPLIKYLDNSLRLVVAMIRVLICAGHST